MRKFKLLLLSILIYGIFPSVSFAVIPVTDALSIAKTAELIVEAKRQYDELVNLKNGLKNLTDVNKDQFAFLQKNLNGNFGYGKLQNSDSDNDLRKWSNDKWVDVLSQKSDSGTSAFADAQKKYEKMYPISSGSEISRSRKDGGLARTHYQQSSQISRAALASSSHSYDQLNKHIDNLHTLLLKLDAEKSEKAAIDLNARLVAELGFIQLDLLRQQSIQNQLIATQTQGDVNGMSDQAAFMKSNR